MKKVSQHTCDSEFIISELVKLNFPGQINQNIIQKPSKKTFESILGFLLSFSFPQLDSNLSKIEVIFNLLQLVGYKGRFGRHNYLNIESLTNWQSSLNLFEFLIKQIKEDQDIYQDKNYEANSLISKISFNYIMKPSSDELLLEEESYEDIITKEYQKRIEDKTQLSQQLDTVKINQKFLNQEQKFLQEYKDENAKLQKDLLYKQAIYKEESIKYKDTQAKKDKLENQFQNQNNIYDDLKQKELDINQQITNQPLNSKDKNTLENEILKLRQQISEKSQVLNTITQNIQELKKQNNNQKHIIQLKQKQIQEKVTEINQISNQKFEENYSLQQLNKISYENNQQEQRYKDQIETVKQQIDLFNNSMKNICSQKNQYQKESEIAKESNKGLLDKKKDELKDLQNIYQKNQIENQQVLQEVEEKSQKEQEQIQEFYQKTDKYNQLLQNLEDEQEDSNLIDFKNYDFKIFHQQLFLNIFRSYLQLFRKLKFNFIFYEKEKNTFVKITYFSIEFLMDLLKVLTANMTYSKINLITFLQISIAMFLIIRIFPPRILHLYFLFLLIRLLEYQAFTLIVLKKLIYLNFSKQTQAFLKLLLVQISVFQVFILVIQFSLDYSPQFQLHQLIILF